jgi:hypothetical protein
MQIFKLAITLSLLASSQLSLAGYEAHEWGTFTSLVGSNGVTQDGMFHEDEKLPDFVHSFGETQRPPPATPEPSPRRPNPDCRNRKACLEDSFFENNVITQKMETPVIYFYSDQMQRVDVNVKFPEGIITETFPAPIATSPTMQDIKHAANGNTSFLIDILNSKSEILPAVDAGNIYSHARNVNSNVIRTNSEMEKFIFYRGMGRFQPRLGIESRGGGLNFSFSQRDRPQATFLVDVNEAGHGQLVQISTQQLRYSIGSETIRQLQDHNTQNVNFSGIVSGVEAHQKLVSSLVDAGLFRDEAEAMINTWEHGYLKVPGLRLLYILPRQEVDQVLPLSMQPAPQNLERVFVGRIELLLDTQENEILNRVLAQKHFFNISSLGRFAEPILRRVREVYVSREQEALRVPDAELLLIFDLLISKAFQGQEGSTIN